MTGFQGSRWSEKHFYIFDMEARKSNAESDEKWYVNTFINITLFEI